MELAKRLKELGVKQESAFYWCLSIAGGTECSWILVFNPFRRKKNDEGRLIGYSEDELISVFSVAELGEILPPHLQIDKYQSSKFLWSVTWSDMKGASHTEKADTEADARAKMLIHLIEEGVVKV